ncbi:FAD/NAD(P)-binding protein, partial [Staphylococcus epidermidis]
SKYLLMNTHAKEITAFSGNISGNSRKEKAGQGLTFYQWWTNTYNDFEDYEGYAPRKYYGEYLLHVLSVIENNLPNNVSLFKKNDRV